MSIKGHRVRRRIPSDIDLDVGLRVRARRITLGLTQEELAQAIGITYQQTHKYERGHNRISVGRLAQIAKALGVPVNFFFDDENNPEFGEREKLVLQMMRAFGRLSPEKQMLIANFVVSIAPDVAIMPAN